MEMKQAPLTRQIVSEFDQMSPQLQQAARYVLDRPHDVALLTMRQQARIAGVQPATMTRLAKHLGLEGYDGVRELYGQAFRDGGLDFARRADEQVTRQKLRGDQALAAEIASSFAAQVAGLAEPETLSHLVAAAETLARARRIYCLGMRSCFPAIAYFHYVTSLVRDGVVLFDGLGGVGADGLRNAASDDVLLVHTVRPYTRAVVEAVDYAQTRNVPVVAITDSAVSPIADRAQHVILVSVDSPSFFHAMTPAFTAVEILAALVAGRGGANALKALEETEAQLAAFHIHYDPKHRERPA
ncbi:MAG: MurR/RpiR family transcriptional regulator [Phenylobacterium sp.]|uniref:MurR/RpiR family transcriptional regulator n=1 Tax=Phenylobacterium sp. TaxID=1871053 RepID=UPI00272595B9|nr:MurR/RpiR family transcriptional regulator [Phenylobacterium sp.]MDO8900857.1 MurR/RpiR family transcriptional regulator [Phenylobacterium sp.]